MDDWSYSPVNFMLCRVITDDENQHTFYMNELENPNEDNFEKSWVGDSSVYLNKEQRVLLEPGKYVLRAKV